MKRLIIFLILLAQPTATLLAQRPVVTAISPRLGSVNEVVSITGTDLPTGSNVQVQFGAARGTVVEASSTLIKASVPPGASHEAVSVTNVVAGLSAKSAFPFQLSFGGTGFDATKLTADMPFAGNGGIYDMCSCDFNSDGRVDVVTTHENSTSLSAQRNASVLPATLSFERTSVTLNAYSRNIICGDLDGDGRPDLMVSGTGVFADRIYFLKNISEAGGFLKFSAPLIRNLSNTGAAMLAMRDLNSDGRPDVVVTNKSSNIISVFRNASSPGFLDIDMQRQDITIDGPLTTFGLSLQDFDGDGVADLAVAPLLDEKVYLLRNTSVNNAISFAAPVVLASTNALSYLLSADLNGDGKIDLAATDVLNNKLLVWPNTSSNGSIQFGAATQFATELSPNGIAVGDLDGDGLQELVVSHIDIRAVMVFSNASSGGVLALAPHKLVVSEQGRHVNVVDYSGDGKPDIAFTGKEWNNLRVMRNKHCVKPKLSHSGTATLCSGQTLLLQATQALNVTYTWTKDGVALAATGASITVSEAGVYAVTIASVADGCTFTSETLTVVSGSGSGSTVVMEPIAAVCSGGSTQLKATPVDGASYIWNGPNGFTATTTTASYPLSNVQNSAAGSYSVLIKLGDCQFTPAAQTLTVQATPQPQITASATAFCAGTTVTLQATTGFASYQWKLNGANYTGAGANTASITTSTAGNYTVVVNGSAGCAGESAAFAITQSQAPVANFEAPSTACLQQAVTFKNTSTYVSGKTPNFIWTFGDGQTSTEISPTHTYTATGTYTASLTAKYSDDCSHTTSKTISVVVSPDVQILAAGSTSICPGESVELILDGDVKSVLWSSGETSPRILATENALYKASITTTAGCTLERTIVVSHLELPQVSINASATAIKTGESVTLTAAGGFSYEWEQAEGIADMYSHTVTVTPIRTTTYTVRAWGENGCTAKAEVTIEVDNTFQLDPPKIFVPAVDGYWVAAGIEYYPDFQLSIVNSLGRTIYAAQPYSNNWDGSERGKPVEPGVYYYIFKDPAGKVLKTGSITLLR